jgi:transketolase
MPKTPRHYEFSEEKEERLRDTARELRIDILRMIHSARSGHPGGSLSAIDWMTALFFDVMRHRPKEPDWRERDRFVLSKGHAGPALYACLAGTGYFDKLELMSLRKICSRLQGHPERKYLKGIEISTGSLGQGLAAGNGMALACRLDGLDNRVFVVLGDGELQEGMIWEAAMSAAHYKIENLCAFVDNNGLQIDGVVAEIMGVYPIAEKFRSFGWNAVEIDGHDFKQMYNALNNFENTAGRPTVVVGKTVKGKGVSFMENNVNFHGNAPNDEEFARAMAELGGEP